MSNKKFNWGILGPGRIAHQFADGLKVIDDATLYAVASSKIERAKEFADEYGGAKTYNSYEALVKDPEVDGVYIATPHRFHFENAMLCLNAGKPVLCEKPLTVNAAETKKLIEASKKNKIFLMEALWTRYLPIYTVIRKWLDEKAIGDISLMVGTFGIMVPKDKDGRWQNPELAGGTLLDMGIYPIAISQWVMGAQPKSVVALAHLGKTGVDELTTVLLKYDNGVISQFHSSFLSNHDNDFLIYGSKGHIRIHPAFWGSTKASLVLNDQEVTLSRPLRAGGFEYQTEEAMDGLDSAVYDEEAETLDVKAGVAWFITGSKIGYNEDLQETKKAPSPSRSTTVTLRRVRSFQPGTISYALSQIEKNVFDWVSSAYAQLAYGNRVKNIWESYRTRVDNTLQNLGLASHLSAIQDDIAKDNPESWRSAVLECRNLLNDLANHLWQDQRETYGPLPGDGPGGKLDVRQGKYANRLSAFLHRKTVTGSEGKFLRDEAERLSASIRSLIELQSSAHEPIARPLAESVVLSTYFMIGELASKTDLAPITDSASSAA